jgi:LysM repeat protein
MFARLIVLFVLAVAVWIGFARPSEGAGHERVYVVQPADTLWAIASASYAGDPREAVWRLRQRNGLRGTVLQPGQRLVLPS